MQTLTMFGIEVILKAVGQVETIYVQVLILHLLLCGANGTSFAALFNDFDAGSGSTGWIESPAFSLSGYTSAALSFWYCNNGSGASPNTTASLTVQYYNGS